MANSAINISANAQEVINLRKRIDELKASLSSMRRSTDPQVYDKLNRELQTSSIRYNRLVGDIQRYVVAQQQAERATSKSSDGLTDLLKKGAALAGITFGAEKIRELGMEIVRVHGEMQQLNIAFSTMLKSQEKADTLMSGLKTFSTDTPFGLMDSAKGAKQLLAYGTTAENIIGDLKMLGNVASGVSAPLGDIVYLYGTLRSQGRAYAMDIRQFAGRGIPIYAELAKVLKVNVDQVNELVSAGKVGFPEVEQAFKNMTSGGGMFEGLMEKQTASVTGQIEKLKDNIQFMFDAIGTSSEGAIYGAINGASTLVENYQAVGEMLVALIATYGLYKAAIITTVAIEKIRATQAVYDIATKEIQLGLTLKNIAAQSSLNKVLAINPYALVAAAVVALSYGVYKLATATSVQELAQESLNKVMDEAKKKKDELSNHTDTLVSTVNSETKTIFDQISAYKQLQGLYPNLLKNMDIQTFKTLGATEQQKLLNTAINELDFTNQEAKLIELNTLYDKFISAQRSNTGGFEIGSVADEISKSLDFSFWDKYSKNANETFEILKQTIAGLEKEKKQRQDNLKEAELQAKPEAERNKLLQDQLQVLKDQEASILESILKTGEYKRNIDGTISPISDVEKKFNSINELLDNWNKNPFAIKNAFASADPVLNELLTKMRLLNEEKKKLTGQLGSAVVPIVNKSTLEKQVKDFKELEESLSPDKLKKLRAGESILPSLVNTNPEEFNKLKKLEDNYKELGETAKKAKKDLKVYEDPDKAAKAAETANKTAETAAEKARKAAQKKVDDQLKMDNDEAKALLDARNTQLENEQELLNIDEEGFEKQQKQIELNHKKSLLSIDKRTQELIEKKQEAERKQWDLDNPKGSKIPFTPKTLTIADLSASDQADLATSTIIASKNEEKAVADLLKSLLEKYQDFNAKRIELEKTYNNDIKALENVTDTQKRDAAKKEAQKQYDKALSNIDLEAFKESINWELVFGNLDRVSTNTLKDLRDKLRGYLIKAGDSISIQDLKAVSEAIDGIDEKLANKTPLIELKDGYKEYKEAVEKVKTAKDELNKLEEKDPLFAKAKKKLTDAELERAKSLSKITKSINDIGSKGSTIVGVGNDVVNMLESFGVSVSDQVKNTLAGIGQVMSGLESIDLTKPFTAVTGTINTLIGIGQTIGSLFGLGGGDELTQKQIDAYKDLLSVLDDVIARQKELLQNSSSSESSKYYQDALDTIEKQREAAKKFLSDDFFESKQNKTGRTYGARERRYIQQDDNQAKLKALGIELKNQYDLLNLTKDEILLIQQKMPGFYANLFDETKDYLQLIVDTEDKTKELGEALQEALTGVSFDNLKDSLDDLVQDVDTTFSDIGDSFEDHMRNAVMNFVKSSYLTAALQDWYDKFAEYAQSGSTDDSFGLTKDETDELRKMYENAYNKAQGLYDSALDAMGVNKGSSSSSQSSSYGTSTSMDQETGGLILGRLTGVHEELIGIGQKVGYIAQWNQPMDEKFNIDVLRAPIDSLSEACQRIELMIEENGNIALQTFYVVKDIKVDTSNLSEINDKLGRIENNTKAFKGK